MLTPLLVAACLFVGPLSLAQSATSSLSGLEFPQGTVIDFLERTGNALLVTPLERTGELWREQDSDGGYTLIMELDEPRWERRELSARQVSLVRRRPATGRNRPREQRLNMTLDTNKPGHALMLALVALVNGDHASLLASFSASPRLARGDDWTIALTPNTAIDGLCALRLNGRGEEQNSVLTSIFLDQCDQRWQEIILQSTPLT
ncbi:MAG: hypothetical protein NXH85_05185 [Pseudomonadaceae bacterium]|nr:hypothetical protein [Pseudomonadaceae bacterium]